MIPRIRLCLCILNRTNQRPLARVTTGIAGLVGCGKSEIIRAVVGLEPIESGMVRVRGAEITSPTPAAMTKQGFAIFPPTASLKVWRWRVRCARMSQWRRSICQVSRATGSCSAAASGASCRGSSRNCRCARRSSNARLRRFPAAIGRKSCWRAG